MSGQRLYVVHSMELPEYTLMANSAVVLSVDRLLELKRQAKVTEMLIKKEEDYIKSAMGDKTHLVRNDGSLMATWIQGADRVKVDTEALKREFNDVYEACTSLTPAPRVFLLK